MKVTLKFLIEKLINFVHWVLKTKYFDGQVEIKIKLKN